MIDVLLEGLFLSEDKKIEEQLFSEESILKRSRSVSMMPFYGIISFCKEKNISPLEFGEHVGKVAAPTWSNVKDAPAKTIAMYFAWNMAPYGAEKYHFEGDEKEAKIVVEDWPNEEEMKAWGIDKQDLEIMFAMNKPILDYLGMTHESKIEDDKITIKLKK